MKIVDISWKKSWIFISACLYIPPKDVGHVGDSTMDIAEKRRDGRRHDVTSIHFAVLFFCNNMDVNNFMCITFRLFVFNFKKKNKTKAYK